MTSRHLVADGDLSLLSDVDAHQLVDAGAQFVAVLAGEDLDIHDDAALAVGDAEGGVAHFSRLLAEDGAQQSLLGGELRLALGRDLADKDVAAPDLCADADDAVLVEVLERVLGEVGDVAGDLLFAELGVTRFDLVLLDVDGGEDVVAHQLLADEDGVLVVVALPAHEADEDVPAEGELAVIGGGTVRKHGRLSHDFAVLLDLGIHPVALCDDGMLVYASGLVAALELGHDVFVFRAVLSLDHDAVGVHIFDKTVALREFERAAVVGDPVLHAGGDHGSLGLQERDCLALHVGTHQRAVGVVVLQEGDERGRDGDELLG